ncbi:hypothetical protein NHX12_034194 [Muraenolepis orangiensis]|uniref:Uncharacterized protein n=1 Tax=Muraenolepis orangiensis TaxID=630683 RepID=A0A9Q0D7B0_9TELE|nr:hypothetical protein NHX12_034194 [Muraenolepis orangiensis]KAJ3583192.1 hypothetical protein NHX12_034194 [Muraenolepis orangiensis]
MNDTYAVINKHKQPLPPTGPTHSPPIAPPIVQDSSAPSHLYDNDGGVPAGDPLYSEVRHRDRPISGTPPPKLIDSPAAPANQQLGEGSPDNKACELVAGFDCRGKKPRGPRAPPVDWRPLER